MKSRLCFRQVSQHLTQTLRYTGIQCFTRQVNTTIQSNNYVDLYESQGYVTIPNVLSIDDITAVGEHVDYLVAKNPTTPPELLEHWFMRNDPFWISLIQHPNILSIVSQFLGDNIACFASHYVCKMPYTGTNIHWHQDGSYWPLSPMKVLSVWLAVDDSTIENGCLQVIPKSHKRSLEIKGLTPDSFENDVTVAIEGSDSNINKNELSLSDNDLENMKYIELNKGSISIHDPMLYHGSNKNESNKRRCGLTIRYIPTDTIVEMDKIDKEKNDYDNIKYGSVYLCKGKVLRQGNYYRQSPVFDEKQHFKPSTKCTFFA